MNVDVSEGEGCGHCRPVAPHSVVTSVSNNSRLLRLRTNPFGGEFVIAYGRLMM